MTDMRPVLYTDLDDTLFQTSKKMKSPPKEENLASEATNGQHSYMTDTQYKMVSWLSEATRLIPVTARSTSALDRCRISFSHWKIASNGGIILDAAGVPDPDWNDHVSTLGMGAYQGLLDMQAFIESKNRDGQFRHWIVFEGFVPIYLCVKSNTDEGRLGEIEMDLRAFAGNDFTYHRNGNNLSFTPVGISKREAVIHLDQLIGPGAMRFGMGDSLTDIPFMGECDMMIVPPGSQIHKSIGLENWSASK